MSQLNNSPVQPIQLEAGLPDRVLRSDSKRKQQQQNNAHPSTEAIDGEQEFPKSIEKLRYVSAEAHSPVGNLFDSSFQKGNQYLKNPHELTFRQQNPLMLLSNDKAEQQNIIKAKKCTQIAYDSSFEDRNSVQTMDSKQFSSSFELEDREFDKSSEGFKTNRPTSGGAKNKDYFDHYVIEDDEENEEEKKTEANAEQNSSQISSKKIELERENSQTHYDQSGNNSEQPEKSLESLDIDELKLIEKRKINQKDEIKAAFNQISDENEILAERVKELEKKLKMTSVESQNYRQYEQMMSMFRIKLNTKKFDQNCRLFRKFSL